MISTCFQKQGFPVFIFMSTETKLTETLYPHTFVSIDNENTCIKYRRKIIYSAWVGAPRSFQIFIQNSWFLLK